jgi:hypothetical protein
MEQYKALDKEQTVKKILQNESVESINNKEYPICTL